MNNTLRDAIQKIKAGDKKQGRQLLIEVLKVDPENVTALLWMSILVGKEHRQKLLDRILEIDPKNEAAKRALSEIQTSQKSRSDFLSKPPEFNQNEEPINHEHPVEEILKQCPFCAETIKSAAILCRYCGKDLTTTSEKNQSQLYSTSIERRDQNILAETKNRGFVKLIKGPFFILAIIGGLVFFACSMCVLVTAISPQEVSPTREIPPTYTPRNNRQQPSTQQNNDAPGIGYLWLENSPDTPIPVISHVHDRFPLDVEELARWILYGEACLADPGTKAFIEDYGLLKIEVTVLEGECIDYNGWIISEAWQDRRSR